MSFESEQLPASVEDFLYKWSWWYGIKYRFRLFIRRMYNRKRYFFFAGLFLGALCLSVWGFLAFLVF